MIIKFKYPVIIFFLLILNHPVILGQNHPVTDTLFNQTDELGRKQGYWKKKDKEGNLIYRGYFKDGTPVGDFIRYYNNGSVKSKMYYLPDNMTVDVKFYYANGKLAAEGRYYNRKKDGEWKYYSFYEDFLSYREMYNHGKKEGESIKYYSNGKIAEKLKWHNGEKNGEWLQYFPDGSPKLVANNLNNKLDGTFIVYHLNGKKEIEGQYKNNMREGEWHTYDLLGNLTGTINYHNGIGDNEDKIIRQQMQLLDSLERNKGRFKEPDLNNTGIHQR